MVQSPGQKGRQNLTDQDAFAVLGKLQKNLFINNEFVAPIKGGRLPVVDPRTGKEIADVASATEEDVDVAVKSARKAFDEGEWTKMSAVSRGKLMYKLADLIDQHLTELALLETLDNGKPLQQCLTKEIPLVSGHFRYFAGYADKLHGKTIQCETEHWAYTLHEPVGVVAAIIPWNFPLVEAGWKLAPALAAGNCVVLKVSKETPLSALKLAELIVEAGFPPGVVNILTGPGTGIGDAMTGHPLVNKVTFTGSTEVGRHVGELSSKDIKLCTLELGGKSPVVVTPDVDIDEAVQIAIIALYYNHGQCCAAGSRLFVHEDIYDEFSRKYVEAAKVWRTGDPFTEVDQGPLVDQKQLDKVSGFVEQGQKEGAKLLCGGKRIGEEGYFFEPTVFGDVKDDMEIAREEIFGPVQCLFKWKTIEEVIRRANDTKYGLAAGVISKDQRTIDRLVRGIRAGTVWVNTYNIYEASVPFGGYNESGVGREKGEYALAAFTQVKAVYQPLVSPAWR